jgi:hypothetical protein
MILLWLALSCGVSAVLGWSLGLRRERGKQHKREQIVADNAPPRGGLRLRRISVRR